MIDTVCYTPTSRTFEISFSSGASLSIPVDKLEMLTWVDDHWEDASKPSDEGLSSVRVWSGGRSIDVPDIHQNFGIDELMVFLPNVERQGAYETAKK